MALNKEITAYNGVKCNYHRIYNYTVDVDGCRTIVNINSYPDESCRHTYKRPVITAHFEIDDIIESRTDIYNWLKSTEYFAGCADA